MHHSLRLKKKKKKKKKETTAINQQKNCNCSRHVQVQQSYKESYNILKSQLFRTSIGEEGRTRRPVLDTHLASADSPTQITGLQCLLQWPSKLVIAFYSGHPETARERRDCVQNNGSFVNKFHTCRYTIQAFLCTLSHIHENM